MFELTFRYKGETISFTVSETRLMLTPIRTIMADKIGVDYDESEAYLMKISKIED